MEASFNGKPWGNLTKKDMHVGDVVVTRWIDVPDRLMIVVEWERRSKNGSGRFIDLDGSNESVEIDQVIEVKENIFDNLKTKYKN